LGLIKLGGQSIEGNELNKSVSDCSLDSIHHSLLSTGILLGDFCLHEHL